MTLELKLALQLLINNGVVSKNDIDNARCETQVVDDVCLHRVTGLSNDVTLSMYNWWYRHSNLSPLCGYMGLHINDNALTITTSKLNIGEV